MSALKKKIPILSNNIRNEFCIIPKWNANKIQLKFLYFFFRMCREIEKFFEEKGDNGDNDDK